MATIASLFLKRNLKESLVAFDVAVTFEPRPIGWFAVDSEGEYRGEERRLVKYLVEPRDLQDVNFDLNINNPEDQYNLHIMSEVKENIEVLLKWIMENADTTPSIL